MKWNHFMVMFVRTRGKMRRMQRRMYTLSDCVLTARVQTEISLKSWGSIMHKQVVQTS